MNITEKRLVLSGALLGAVAVILGALGAHALKAVLTATELTSFETGVKYQMYHAFLLLVIAVMPRLSSKHKKRLGNLILAGVLCFSVSIYFLVIDTPILGISLKFLGPITPIGGLLLIAAWGYLFYSILKLKTHE